MIDKNVGSRIAELLKNLRKERGISQLQLADHVGVNSSVVSRAESGHDARISTWEKLFIGLGYELLLDTAELSEEGTDFLLEEAALRRERRLEGLCTGKRRYY